MAIKKNNFKKISFTTTESPLISIVIPVYNQVDYTIQCLQSIYDATDKVSYEVIVIDDCSTDETEEVLSQINGLRYFRNKENLGFVRNNNLAADYARGEYLFLLNNDTEVQSGYLEWSLKIFENFKDVAAVGSKLIFPDGKLQEAGGIIFSNAQGWNYGKYDDAESYKYNFVREVDYCSAAALLVKKEIFIKLGKFDELFVPAYCEDSDFQFTARENGYKVYYQPKSVVVHHEGISNGKDLGESTTGIKKYQYENLQKFKKKHTLFLDKNSYEHEKTDVALIPFPKGKEHIFIIDDHLLTPDQDSGSQKFYNFMKLLQEKFQVTFLVKLPNHPIDNFEKYYDLLTQEGIRVVINKGKKRDVDFVNFLTENSELPKFVLLSRPEVAITFFNKVKKCTRPDCKILYDTADLHHLRMLSQADNLRKSGSDNVKAIGNFIEFYRKYRSIETFILKSVDQVWAITQEEKDYMISTLRIDASKVMLVPNVLNCAPTPSTFVQRKNMIFIGGFDHLPNIDAIKFYQDKIVPELKKRGLKVTLNVVGSKSNLLGHLPRELMDVIGFVEDPVPHFDNALFAFYPLVTGAGMKGKITQALGLGVPVITTDIGAQGYLGAEEYMLIGNNEIELADKIELIIKDRMLWEKLRNNGLRYFDENLSFNTVRKIFSTL